MATHSLHIQAWMDAPLHLQYMEEWGKSRRKFCIIFYCVKSYTALSTAHIFTLLLYTSENERREKWMKNMDHKMSFQIQSEAFALIANICIAPIYFLGHQFKKIDQYLVWNKYLVK